MTVAGYDLTGNDGPDLDASFGARATIDATAAEAITCDGTVLLRGEASCP